MSKSTNLIDRAEPSAMDKLVERQLRGARDESGSIDIERLRSLIRATYDDFERERRRNERANMLMSEELSEANDLLSVQNMRFEAALDNMGQGLGMFDREHRLVVCNERLGQLFGHPARALHKLGIEAFIATVFADEACVDDAATLSSAYRALAESREHAVLHLEQCRDRMLLVTHQPLEDGGFVHTFEDITARREAEAKAAHLASHDVLTDLPNRRLLQQRLDSLMAIELLGRGCAVLCLDLDRFKPVNDMLGHAAGDQLLLAVTERLRNYVRANDTVARLGGDEFAVVLPGVRDRQTAGSLAGRLVQVLSGSYEIAGTSVNIGVSIGVALAPEDARAPNDLIKCADMALYQAKRDGRGCHRFFESGMDDQARARGTLESDLRRALDRGEFELNYQPLVSLDARRVCGFEALLRWNSPTRGRVPPDQFIPMAEELGLIVPIGDWVLMQGCRAAVGWPDHVKIAINVSPLQFRTGTLVDTVKTALLASGLAPSRLELEITESVLMDTDGESLRILHALRAYGVSIVMDDFGTGYSSLAYLRSFPFDKVKIDRSFITGLGAQGDSMAIVRAVTGMCTSLGIPTTAEGVETLQQLELLSGEHCNQVQGFLFSKPCSADQVLAVLASSEAFISASRQ